ncbi:MAG TPA: NHL repeat-containing protein [Nitrospirota bacterium]|nr:NHL repeat-containing protein [Nitrospirota bacterium]
MMRSLFLIMVLTLPSAAFGAEVIQFRYVVSAMTDTAGVSIKQPEGVACNDNSLLVVSDTARGRLQPFTVQEGSLKPGAEIKVPYPLHVRLNSKGDLFVLDGKQRKILHFGPQGEPKGDVQPQGIPAPAAWIPKNFAVGPDDSLAILDIFSARVVVVDAEGKFQRQLPLPAKHGFFSDVAVDPQGTIFVLDSVAAVVYAAGPNDKEYAPLTKGLHDYVAFPTSIAADKRFLYVVDQNSGSVLVLGKDGAIKGRKLRMGWKEGELRYPADICINGKGEVFIADRGNNRVGIYALETEHK